MSEGFKYPGDSRIFAKTRRGVFAFACGLLVLGLISVLFHPDKTHNFPDWLPKIIPNLMPEEWQAWLKNMLPYWIFFGAAVGAVWRYLSKPIDFHLFPYFDTSDNSGFKPITRVTGELVWSGPIGEEQKKAWIELKEWSQQEIGKGYFKLSWIFNGKVELNRGEDKYWFKQFDCAFLLGGNGVGKSQLALELARDLALRQDFGDSYRYRSPVKAQCKRFKFWFFRICPFTKTDNATAWNVALINYTGNDPTNYFTNWRPSKPTFLILDDPSFDKAKKIIDYFKDSSRNFWYPVRLLVLDQFMPQDLDVHEDDGKHFWGGDTQQSVTVSILKDIKWEANNLRQAFARGLWGGEKDKTPYWLSINHLRSLKNENHLNQLCNALEGNPYLLSVALHWLSKHSQDIPALINEVKTSPNKPNQHEEEHPFLQIEKQASLAKRLLNDRMIELYKSHEKTKTQEIDIQRMLVLAAICRKYKLNHSDKTVITNSKLKNLIPSYHNGVIPALGPWVLCELYVVKYFNDVLFDNAEKLHELIIEAYNNNPDGVIRSFFETGWLAAQIQIALEKLESNDEKNQFNIIEASIHRALWVAPEDIGKTIQQINTYLEKYSTVEKIENLWEILQASNKGSHFFSPQKYPNYLARNTLAIAITKECLKKLSNDEHLSDKTLKLIELLQPWLRSTNYDLRYFPVDRYQVLAQSIKGLITVTFYHLDNISDFEQRTRFAEQIRNKMLNFIAPRLIKYSCNSLLDQLQLENLDVIQKTDAAFMCEIYLWYSLSSSDLSKRLFYQSKIALLANANPSRIELHEKLAESWLSVAFARTHIDDQRTRTEEVIPEIEKIAEAFPGNESIQEALAGAWTNVAFARSQLEEQRNRAEEVIPEIEKIAEAFPGNESIQQALALAWTNVALARAHIDDQRTRTEEVIPEIEKIAEAFPGNESIQEALAGAWANVAFARAQLEEQRNRAEEVIPVIMTISNCYPDSYILKLALLCAWREVAYARSNLEDQRTMTEDIIPKVEQIAEAYLFNELIQEKLADILQFVSYGRSYLDDQRVKSEEVIPKIEKIAEAFPGNESIQEALAGAWTNVAFARSQLEEQRNRAEEVIPKVEQIAEAYLSNELIQEKFAVTYRHVSYARSQLEEQRNRAEEVIPKIEKIAKAFPKNVTIQEEVANAWVNVTYARVMLLGSIANCEEAKNAIEEIAMVFPKNVRIHTLLANALYLLVFVQHEQKSNALKAVEELYERHPTKDILFWLNQILQN